MTNCSTGRRTDGLAAGWNRSRLPAMVLAAIALQGCMNNVESQQAQQWPIHALDRPQPRVVNPGPAAAPARPPSDAVVLFDGKDLSKWRNGKGEPARWKVENGYFEVAAGTGGIQTAESYGDVQLHIEWASPSPAHGESQDRGNSGVFFAGTRYEVQILDSYAANTYPDGQAGALYGRMPPLVNASRAPGEWQTYDIIYRGPRFDDSGKLLRPARFTVIHNNVLIHDAFELPGPTANKATPPYVAHPAKLPISLQDHAHPVRFRNIWLRELNDQ